MKERSMCRLLCFVAVCLMGTCTWIPALKKKHDDMWADIDPGMPFCKRVKDNASALIEYVGGQRQHLCLNSASSGRSAVMQTVLPSNRDNMGLLSQLKTFSQ